MTKKELAPVKTSTPRHNKVLKLAILNAPIFTTNGTFAVEKLELEQAKHMANMMPIESFIGHDSTSKILSQILHRPIEFSREEFKQKLGQKALVFKLRKRAPEGTILTIEEIEEIGYDFWEVYKYA